MEYGQNMIKYPVVDGAFYPKERDTLARVIDDFITKQPPDAHGKPKAIVVPHAGYIYSGQIAAFAYQRAMGHGYKDVIVISPSHHYSNKDFFVGDYDAYDTPLGQIKTNKEKIMQLKQHPEFIFDPQVDSSEHALEVQLPFIKHLLPEAKIVPIIFMRQNRANAKKLAEYLIDILDSETLLVISTDLSHFHRASVAEHKDKTLIEHFLKNDIDGLYDLLVDRRVEACGFGGILTQMYLINTFKNTKIENVSYTHSGNISGDNSSVVGYFSCTINGYDID